MTNTPRASQLTPSSPPTRVLVASNMYPGKHGPYFGVFVQRHVDVMRRDSRLRLDVVAIDDPRKGYARSFCKYGRFFLTLGTKLVMHPPHVVHYHYALPTALLSFAHAARIPYVVTLHGGDFYEMPSRIPAGERALTRVLRGATQLIAVGHTLGSDLASYLGSHAPPITVIDMGVDTESFFPLIQTPQHQPNSTRENMRRIAFVGQLIARKGVDVLLGAIAVCRTRGVELSLVIIGDGPMRPALERQSLEHGLSNVVTFVGATAPSRVPSYLNGAGVLVVPSRSEALGVAALEGQAAGLVVVASEVGGLREVVTHEVDGYLVPPESAEALAQRLLELQSGSPEALSAIAKLRVTARAHAEHHAVTLQVARVTDILLAAAAKHAS